MRSLGVPDKIKHVNPNSSVNDHLKEFFGHSKDVIHG